MKTVKLATMKAALVVIFVSVVATLAGAEEGRRYSHTGPTLISGIRVIDGLGNNPKKNQDILITDGKIAGIGPSGSLDAPEGALVIEGNGMTAMPGLMDLHIHIQGGWANGLIPGEAYAPRLDEVRTRLLATTG